ncbi:MAG: hypothetical protein V1922_01850 [bacterium]
MNLKFKISNLKFAALFVYLFICIFVYSPGVQAQQVNLSLDPPIVQAKIKSGKSIIVAYTVENSGDPTNLQFLIRPFTPVGQLGSLTVSPQLEGPVQFNLENADMVLEKPFFFASKEKKQAVVRIHVPPGIPDGDYYYLILAETVPAFSIAGQSTGVASASIGSPLLISITDSGITEVKATIADFSFVPSYVFTIGNNVVRIVDNAKELPIVCSVRNMGKNLIQPVGTILDQNGSLKKKYTIIPQNVLSNSQRILKVSSDENAGQADSTLVLSHLSIGSHRVTVELIFGENTTLQYKTLTFLALPLRLIGIALVALFVVLLIFLMRYSRRKKQTHI